MLVFVYGKQFFLKLLSMWSKLPDQKQRCISTSDFSWDVQSFWGMQGFQHPWQGGNPEIHPQTTWWHLRLEWFLGLNWQTWGPTPARFHGDAKRSGTLPYIWATNVPTGKCILSPAWKLLEFRKCAVAGHVALFPHIIIYYSSLTWTTCIRIHLYLYMYILSIYIFMYIHFLNQYELK